MDQFDEQRDQFDTQAEKISPTLDIIFDGPPGPESGRFVEVEVDGRSVRVGEWLKRGECWVLQIKRSPAVAAALREQGQETSRLREKCNLKDDEYTQQVAFSEKIIADLRAENERLQCELLTIGDMAVVDFDDAVVGAVDKAVPSPPTTYIERRRAELVQHEAMQAEIAALQAQLKAMLNIFDRGLEAGTIGRRICDDARAAMEGKP